MNAQRPPRTLEEIENALLIAGLALRMSRNPTTTRAAMVRIAELKQLQAELRRVAA